MVRFYTHKKHKKNTRHQKVPKSTKNNLKYKNITKQKHKNANKGTKIKNALKKHKWKKATYSLICEEISLYNRNVAFTKLVKVLSALYEQKLVY